MYTLAIGQLAACWILWILALAYRTIRSRERYRARRPSSFIGGILMILAGLSCLLTHLLPGTPHNTPVILAASMAVGPLSVTLAMLAAFHHTGLHQLEASIHKAHVAEIAGPYRWLRCPMYASLLGMAVATALACSSLLNTIIGMPLVMIGIEIGVYAEDRLLADSFQELFMEYSATVRAYIPFLR